MINETEQETRKIPCPRLANFFAFLSILQNPEIADRVVAMRSQLFGTQQQPTEPGVVLVPKPPAPSIRPDKRETIAEVMHSAVS